MKLPKYMQERYLKVPQKKYIISSCYTSVSIDEITKAWNEAAKSGWYDIQFELNLEDCDYDGCHSASLVMTGLRDETVEEFETRLNNWKQGEENKRKAAIERRKERDKKERETYERLKAKYGDK